MFDNPYLVLVALCLCTPGILPMIVVAYIARNYNVRNPLTSRRGGVPAPILTPDEI